MKRTIIKIDENKCTGCGLCAEGCHEGALQIIDDKARLVSELFCDGLGACIGECPEDAITLEEREAQPYNETETIKRISAKGDNTIIAHLKHLKEHNETEYLKKAIHYLKENNFKLNYDEFEKAEPHNHVGGCPGSKAMDFRNEIKEKSCEKEIEDNPSELRQWPIQLHLINPTASYYKNADVILVADCVAYSIGNFHEKYLKGKSIAIACPKLDSNKEIYVEKIKQMIDEAEIKSLNVMIMEVPCCNGLLQMAKHANEEAKKKVDIEVTVIGIKGEVKK
ncbi:MAG: 4Fe-4S binding protein [Bacteroidales bacterium]|jgi:ferredoxin